MFGDEVMAAALIDRLVHHCHIITIRGNSYRMRQHTELWQAVHTTPDPARADAAPVRRSRRTEGSSPRRTIRFSTGGSVRFWPGVDRRGARADREVASDRSLEARPRVEEDC